MRGAHIDSKRLDRVCGLTPAGAGSTQRSQARKSANGAYPRRCGEHKRAGVRKYVGKGLPPQVRGAQILRGACEIIAGLTPAGAGSTAVSTAAGTLLGAYPRRCGEHTLTFGVTVYEGGLPPQVRGALRSGRHARLDARLTPAGAGST